MAATYTLKATDNLESQYLELTQQMLEVQTDATKNPQNRVVVSTPVINIATSVLTFSVSLPVESAIDATTGKIIFDAAAVFA